MIRKNLIILISLGVFLLLLGFSLFLYFQPSFNVFQPGLDYQLRISEGEIVGRRRGEVQWRLIIDEVEEMDGHSYHFTGGSYGEFYGEGEVVYMITSDEIIYDTKRGELDFIGSVVLENPQGDLLKSQRLLWNDRDEELTSPGPVQLFVGYTVLEAESMKGFYRDDIFDFFDDVILTVPLRGQDRDKGREDDE